MDATASFAAWVAALMHPRDRAHLAAAVDGGARIERHDAVDRGQPPGTPVEIFDGIDAIGRWLYRLGPGVTFTLAGPATADGDRWRVEYALEVEGFRNGGVWIARFGDDGRVHHLVHVPFALR